MAACFVNSLSQELQRKLDVAVGRMPAFPRSVQKILELSRNIDCLPRDLVGVIEKDPVMTMKVLKVINSACYNLPCKITSVAQSVVYLGINTVKNLSLSFAAIGILPRMNDAGFDIQRYLLHSLVTAVIARQLCDRYARGEADSGDCHIAGLLHDFGKVIFAQFMALEFRQALDLSAERHLALHEAEREVIGVDHGITGALLAERWQFPERLVECIRLHHAPGAAHSALLDCVRMADQICRFRALGDAGNPWRPNEPPAAPERFGEDMAQVVDSLGDIDKVVSDAMLFVEAGK